MANNETQTVQADTPASEPSTAPNLNLQDLISVAQIIQVTSQRGAYRAEEMESVGALYNKLIAFLQSVGAISPAGADQEQAQSEEK